MVMTTQLKTCLVIGGGGWTGSYIVNQLLQEAHEYDTSIIVHVMDIVVPTSRMDLHELHQKFVDENGVVISVCDKIIYHQCDITNSDDVVAKLEAISPTCIFHTASIVDLRKYPSPLLAHVNIHGTFNVLRACYEQLKKDKKCVKFLVYTSSIDVVAGKYGIAQADEETPYTDHPSNHYKGSKIVAETEVLRGNGDFCGRLRTCCLRPAHIFGAGDALMQHVGAMVSKDSSYPIAIGPPTASMSFVSAHNCAYAHILAMRGMVQEYNDDIDKPVADWNGKVAGSVAFISDFDMNFCDFYQILTSHNSGIDNAYCDNDCYISINRTVCSKQVTAMNVIDEDLAVPGVFRMRVSTWFLELLVYFIEEIFESLIYFLFGNTNANVCAHSYGSGDAETDSDADLTATTSLLSRFLNRFVRQHPVTGITSSMVEACGQLTCVSTRAREMIGYGVGDKGAFSAVGNHTGSHNSGKRIKGAKVKATKASIQQKTKGSPVQMQTKQEAILQCQIYHMHKTC